MDSSLTDAVFRIYDAETGGLVHEREMSNLRAGRFRLSGLVKMVPVSLILNPYIILANRK